MNFNLDDPLAGILSDGSDDSFFDDDILGKKKPTKKPEPKISEKKSTFFELDDKKSQNNATKDKDIFGEKKIQKESVIEDRPKNETLKSISPTPFIKTISKESVFQQVDASKSPAKLKLDSSVDNVLNDLGIHPKKDTVKTLEMGKSSQSLLDDILGGSSSKTGGTKQTARPTTAAKKPQFDLDSFLESESRPTVSSKLETQKPSKTESVKEASQAKKTKSNDDWLGIFQEKDNIMEEEEDDDDVPAWLGGGGSKKKKKAREPKAETPQVEEVPKQNPKTIEEPDKEPINVEHVIHNVTTNIPNLEVGQEDVTMQGAALYLQQQESPLMVALQLKAQDEKLAALQMRQKESQRVRREAVTAQHEQLDAMLRRQADHRKQMQTIIAAHQERITQRIKDLLGDAKTDTQEIHDTNEYDGTERVEHKESPFAKERKQLLQLVQSLQENHDKEIDLMETSYRRQLAFLEVSFNQSEERMKEESDKLVRFYSEKIGWLEEHHQLYKKMSEENLNSLTERHKAENHLLRQQHLENIKVLQEHHATLMENVKNAVKQEQVLIKDSASFSLDLQELLTKVNDGNEKCTKLYEKIEILSQNTQKDSDRSLHIRETQISDMVQQLKMDRENFEKEKSESKDMVNVLEARLKQMTSMIEEESASLRQKKMEFEFEKATFSKQTEFAKNVLKKQDEEIKMMKDEIQKEYQEKISRIEEEKMKSLKDSALVAKEKASIQSLKLELEKMKAQLQAQIEETTEERSKLNSLKQELQIEEQRVLSKSRDLDLLAKTAMEKQSQADKKYSEAEFLQRKYEDRIRRIQEHVVSLNTREKQIAKEKVALSRERLSLHNEKKEIESRQQCSLCRSSQYTENVYVPSYVPVSRDYGNMANVIEAEMAQLMGMRQDVGFDGDAVRQDSGAFKDYMDPKLMMLRLDVQQVISNLDQNKKDENERNDNEEN